MGRLERFRARRCHRLPHGWCRVRVLGLVFWGRGIRDRRWSPLWQSCRDTCREAGRKSDGARNCRDRDSGYNGSGSVGHAIGGHAPLQLHFAHLVTSYSPALALGFSLELQKLVACVGQTRLAKTIPVQDMQTHALRVSYFLTLATTRWIAAWQGAPCTSDPCKTSFSKVTSDRPLQGC